MKRASKNFLSIIGSDIGRRVIGFFTVAYLARKLGTADFGIINIAFTVLSYAVMASAGGLGTYGAREIAKGSNSVVNLILSIRIITALIAYALVAAVALLMIPNPIIVQVILIACVTLFANALMLEWFFQGREAMGMIGVGRLISAVVYFLFVILFVRAPGDIRWVAIAAVAGDVLSAVFMLAVYRIRFEIPFRIQFAGWVTTFTRSMAIGFGSILGHFSINFPPLVIGIILTTSDAGIYSAAQKMVFFLLMFDRVLGTLLMPAAARMHVASPELLAANLSFALRWILITALPLTLGGTILSTQIIGLVFGSQYLAAGPVFQVLIWYFFFTMLHTIYTSGLIAIGEERRYTRIMMISAALYAAAVVAGTKFFGVIGAAAGIAGAEAVTLLLMRLEFKKFVKTALRKSLIIVLTASVLMCVVLVILPPLDVMFSIAIGGCVYIVLLFALKAITMNDVNEVIARLV